VVGGDGVGRDALQDGRHVHPAFVGEFEGLPVGGAVGVVLAEDFDFEGLCHGFAFRIGAGNRLYFLLSTLYSRISRSLTVAVLIGRRGRRPLRVPVGTRPRLGSMCRVDEPA